MRVMCPKWHRGVPWIRKSSKVRTLSAGCNPCRMQVLFRLPHHPRTRFPNTCQGGWRSGREFLQGESEIASINMVLGAAASGVRAMTSSSSPGISLKQEGLSFLAALELPAVIVNINRGGPGLGNIAPSQGDYYQATRGGGHGDYRMPVYAPASVQELYDITMRAFDVADLYRTPVMILGDGMMGQIVEPIYVRERPMWSLRTISGRRRGRPSRIVKSLILDPSEMEGTTGSSSASTISAHDLPSGGVHDR